MSTTIDQRVVEMRFDNQNFEKNVQTSMSTLDKLKEKLHLKGVSKGLDEVSSAAKRCNLSPISSAVEGVKVKFSAMEVMAVTALANITNSAVNAGKRIVSALTIEPITTGFNEYELKMNSVQTIMASTGEDIKTVNKYLDELNTYSDKTIYSFSDMTENIGKFTNAGVKLEDAVLAIKGISNEAAVSGANANEASRAMYNFAQALSSGSVRLIDWKSIENANMATVEFKDTLIKTAEELGTVTKVGDKYQSTTTDLNGKVSELFTSTTMFNDSLSSQWMTTDVLIEALKQYASETTDIGKKAYSAAQDVKTMSQLWDTLKEAAQSGWARTWELIIGDLEEAKKLWTAASKFFGGIVDAMSNGRNAILESALGKNFRTIADKIEGAIAPAKKAADTINNVKEAVSDLGDVVNDVILGKFGNGQERIDKLTAAGQNYYRVQNKVNETLGNTFRYTEEQIAAQDKLLGTQSKVTDGTKEEASETVKLTDEKKNLIKKIASMTEEQMRANGYTDEQIDAFKELGKTAEKLGMPLDEFIDKMDEIDGRWLLIESFKNIGKSLVEVFKAVGAAWNNIFPTTQDEQAEKLFDIIAAIHKFSRGVLTAATDNADELRRTFEGLFAILDLIRMVAGGTLGVAFRLLKALLDSMNMNILDVTANIGDALVAFRNWVKENNFIVNALEKVISFVGTAIVAIRDFVKKILEIPEVQNAITNFKNACTKTFSRIGDFFSEGSKRIQDFIDRVKAMDSITLADLGKIFEDFRTNVLGFSFDFDMSFDGIKNTIKQFKEKFKSGLGEVGEKFEWAKNKASDFVEFIKSKIPAAIAIAMGAMLIKGVTTLGKALSVLASPIEGVSDLLEKAGKVLNSFSGYIKAKAWNERADAVLKLALALGVLTACIIALTMVNQDKLWTAVKALAALMGILTVFTLLVTVIGKLGTVGPGGVSKGLTNMSISMIAIAVSLLILVNALKKMEDLDLNKVVGDLTIMGILLGGLILAAAAIGKFGQGTIGGAIGLLAMIVALRMLVDVLAKVDDLNLRSPAGALVSLLGLIGMLGLLAAASKSVKLGGAIGLIALVVGLKMFIRVIEDIANINLGKLKSHLGSIIVVFGMIALLMAASNLAGKHAAQAGIGIAAISVGLLLMTKAIEQLGMMNRLTLERGTKVVSALLVLFAGIVAVSYFAGKHAMQAGMMLLAMSTSILMLTGVIYLLKDLEPDGLYRAVGAITVLGTVFALLIGITKLAQGSVGTLVILTVAITALAVAIMALSTFDQSSLITATACLNSVIGMFALLTLATSMLSGIKVIKTLGTLIVLTLLVGALGYLIADLAKMNPGPTLEIAKSLSMVLLALTGACLILSKMSSMKLGEALPTVLVLGLITAGIGYLLAHLSSLIVGPTLEIAASISLVLLALSSACLILSKMSNMKLGEALPTVIVLGLIAAGIGYLLAHLSSLVVGSTLEIAASISLVLLALSTACVILSHMGSLKLGEVLPTVIVLGVITAALGYVLVALSKMDPGPTLEIAASLTLLLLGLSGACVILGLVGKLGAGGFIGVGVLATLIAAMAVIMGGLGALVAYFPDLELFLDKGIVLLEKIGQGLGSFLGNIVGGVLAGVMDGLPSIGTSLSEFMDELQPFLAGARNVDSAAMNGIKALAETILILTAANILDGLTSWFTGGTSLSDFASELGPVGDGLATFGEKVKDIDSAKVEAGAKALETIALAANKIPNDGGWLGAIMGENNIGDFAAKLADAGTSLTDFSNNVAGMSLDNVQKGSDGLVAIAEAANSIPNDGGWLGEILGENNIGGFCAKLPAVGQNLTDFSNNVAGMVLDNVNNGAKGLSAIAAAAHAIPNDGGLIAELLGENNIGGFCAKLPTVGSNLTQFSSNVAGMVLDNVQNGADGLLAIANAAHAIPNTGGIMAKIFGDNDAGTFGSQLEALGSGIKDFATNAGGVGEDRMNAATSALGSLIDLSKKIPDDNGNWLSRLFGTDNISTFCDNLGSLGTGLNDFSSNAGYIDMDVIDAAAKAVAVLSNMSEYTPDDSTKIVTFGADLQTFSSYLKSYYNEMASVPEEGFSASSEAIRTAKKLADDIQPTKIQSAVDSLNSMVNMARNMSSVKVGATDGFVAAMNSLAETSVNGFVNTFESAKIRMPEVAKSFINEFVAGVNGQKESLKTIGGQTGDKFIEGVSGQRSKFAETGYDLAGEFVNGLKGKEDKIKNASKSITDIFIKNVSDQNEKIINLGKTVISKFLDGVKNLSDKVKKAFNNLVTTYVNTLKSGYNDFYNAGSYLVKGFANGISANTFVAQATARTMARAALNAAEAELDINSPSKEGYRLGDFLGQGFTNALNDYASVSYNSGSRMAEYAKRGLSGAISKINDFISNDVDSQPTIRPVVDLSDVKTGVRALDSMLNFGPSVGVVSNVGTISSMMNMRNQNGANDDVISAIRDLSDKLSNASGDSYNVGDVTYDDGSNVASAVKSLVRAARVERRR